MLDTVPTTNLGIYIPYTYIIITQILYKIGMISEIKN